MAAFLTRLYFLSTYWMAGLAPHAANYFKFLLILVLYTISMALFVRLSLSLSVSLLEAHILGQEFPPWLSHIGRRPRDSSQRDNGTVPNDVCGLLRPPRLDSAGAAVAAVDVSAQVCARGVIGERGQLGAPDPGRIAGRARGRFRISHYASRAWAFSYFCLCYSRHHRVLNRH